ncbi:type VII secretion target [uncultured Mycolicibacterium sp.]|uniref:type VII secretion target n=1 Tax=uncultured Mycolicibacterium sp. TaxID=2320817 RepID=UPI002616AFFF|nr:type VII secretion target [uncultured Mycolicibacterium sp.]
MAKPVRVVPEDLRMSADRVDVCADDLRGRHGSADSRIETARGGLPAAAAAALDTALAKWRADTTAVVGRMIGHGAGLRAGAAQYQHTDHTGAEAIDRAMPRIDPDDMGL